MKAPFPDRESTFEAFASHVSRGKVAFFQQAGLDLVAGASTAAAWRASAFRRSLP